MPRMLKRAVEGAIPVASQYSCGQIAFLMQVSHRTAAKMIDDGLIRGYRMMSGKKVRSRERRVLHESLVAFINKYPDYRFMFNRLENYDPTVDFGKDYEERWNRQRPKRRKLKVMEELSASDLACGRVHESSQETEKFPPESS